MQMRRAQHGRLWSRGPALRIGGSTGCSVVGIDVQVQAVTTARSLAAQRGLAERAEFWSTDVTGPLPFSDASYRGISGEAHLAE